jgi:hypothetical protein
MDASVVSEKSLADVLGARARRTPVDRLVLDVVGGLLIGAAAVWARPFAWFPLLAAALCFACYGCWAITERRLHPETSSPVSPVGPAWRVVRQVAAVLGIVAYVTLLFAVLGLALGPIKS